jgi:hypothetical protein
MTRAGLEPATYGLKVRFRLISRLNHLGTTRLYQSNGAAERGQVNASRSVPARSVRRSAHAPLRSSLETRGESSDLPPPRLRLNPRTQQSRDPTRHRRPGVHCATHGGSPSSPTQTLYDKCLVARGAPLSDATLSTKPEATRFSQRVRPGGSTEPSWRAPVPFGIRSNAYEQDVGPLPHADCAVQGRP